MLWSLPIRTHLSAMTARHCGGAMEHLCRSPMATITSHFQNFSGALPLSISSTSPIRPVHWRNHRPSTPIRGGSATPGSAKMYGDCQKNEVSPRLVSLAWLPKTWGRPLRITSVNGIDKQLRAVSAEIDALAENIKRAAYPIAGTYNCRTVADTGQPIPHGYGIAIDLNTTFSDYWYWQRHEGVITYHNRMPPQIVSIFEKHGFIWGGKWYHFDTMHFEYRPELLSGNPMDKDH